MRALHVIAGVGASDGGPSVAVRGMTEALAARGIQVSVATTNADGAGSLDVPLDRPVMEGGVTFHYFRRTMPGSWKFSVPLTQWLWHHVHQFDVVHVHALFSYSTIPACRIARWRGVPYVIRPLGTLDAWSLGQKSWRKAPYLRLVERSHLDHAAALHATSEAEGDSLRALGYPDRTRVIPLGVSVPSRESTNAEGAGQPLRLLFLSRLHEKKGIPLLLEALASPGLEGVSWTLDIAGRGDPQYESFLREQCARLGLAARVRFVGQVEGDVKAALMRASDVFVLPSHSENFGIAVAEAMAAGLPVIVTPGVALASEVRASSAGIVAELHATSIAQAIAAMAECPAERQAMGARGRAFAESRFSWNVTAEQLESLYAEIAA